MLTPDQLAAIKARLQAVKLPRSGNVVKCHATDIAAVLNELERLTRHNQRMSAALAQLSDGENWLEAIGSDNEPSYIWLLTIDPQQLAERVLVKDE